MIENNLFPFDYFYYYFDLQFDYYKEYTLVDIYNFVLYFYLEEIYQILDY